MSSPFSVFAKLSAVLDTEALGMLANFGQHVLAASDPKAELKRLLSIIDSELKPAFRISKTGK